MTLAKINAEEQRREEPANQRRPSVCSSGKMVTGELGGRDDVINVR